MFFVLFRVCFLPSLFLLTRNTIELYPTIFKTFTRNRWRLVLNIVVSNISGHWLKIKKLLLKKYGSKNAVNLQWTSLGSAMRQRTQWYFAIECVVSIAPRAEDHCKFTAILPHFFNNYSYFIFSQWPLIFDKTKFTTSLHRFLLKFLKIVG